MFFRKGFLPADSRFLSKIKLRLPAKITFLSWKSRRNDHEFYARYNLKEEVPSRNKRLDIFVYFLAFLKKLLLFFRPDRRLVVVKRPQTILTHPDFLRGEI